MELSRVIVDPIPNSSWGLKIEGGNEEIEKG